MRCVKYIITVLIALFSFVMTSELYQLHLQTFTNCYFFLDIDNDDRNQISSIVSSVAKQHNEFVFAVKRDSMDAFHSKLYIYADTDTQDILSLTHDIFDGETESLFSGSTDIIISSFENVADDKEVDRYYFTGSKETVSSIRQSIYSQIPTSYIHKDSPSVINVLIYGIWMVLLGFILLLTWVDIQFSKKKDFLKISMGSHVGRMVLCKVLADMVFNVAVFGLIYLVLKNKIFLIYKLDFVFWALIIFFVLNSFLYITLFNINYKEVMYGANVNGKLLANTYLLQAIVVILLVVSLSTNLVTLTKNKEELAPYDTIEQLDGYNLLSITPTEQVLQNDEGIGELEVSIYLEAYIQDKILLSTFCAAIEDEPIVVLNEKALNTVVSKPELFHVEAESDFVVYIPESRYSNMEDYDIEFAAATTASEFFGLEKYSFESRAYSHVDVTYFDLRNESELTYGADSVSDPIIVYCNLSNLQLDELLKNNANIDFGDRWANVIFDMTDISLLSRDVTERLADVKFINVIGLLEQYKSNLLRGILLNSVLSSFLLILSFLLISTIVKMEYLIHSKELALKKILGYSVIQRNAMFLVLNIFATFIAFITGIILVEMYGIFEVWMLCAVSIVVFIINFILILFNMAIVEKHNTTHILKGGSL